MVAAIFCEDHRFSRKCITASGEMEICMKRVLIWLAVSLALMSGAYLSVKSLSQDLRLRQQQTDTERLTPSYIFYTETARFYVRDIQGLKTLINKQLSTNGTNGHGCTA